MPDDSPKCPDCGSHRVELVENEDLHGECTDCGFSWVDPLNAEVGREAAAERWRGAVEVALA
jgi:uncharacterized Zn finger protein